MKCQIPQISWHSRDPVLSIDFQPIQSDLYRLASGGTDSHVLIWYITYQENKTVKIECASDLYRHNKSVNVVRFSPNGESLASGDDEGAMFIWQPKEREQIDLPKDDENINKEEWYPVKLLRGHLEDIYDISWSKDGNFLVSASTDNTAIMWDMQKFVKIHILSDFKGYVQGVSWDPKNQFIASLGSDRTLRLHNVSSKKSAYRISKAPWTNSTEKGTFKARLFYDDTLKSYYRRLSFTPDGELLIVPSGIVDKGEKVQNASYIFSKHAPSKPVVSLNTGDKYTVAVRCNPFLYKLRRDYETIDKENEPPKPLIDLPYRMIFAVAACDSVFVYDTETLEYFAYISNIHYTHLTDLAWSPDGLTLVTSSTDGYCSFIVFTKEELGEIYVPEEPKETDNGPEEISEMSKNDKMDVIQSSDLPSLHESEKVKSPATPKSTPSVSAKNTPPVSAKSPKVLAANSIDESGTPSSKIAKITDNKKFVKKSPKMCSIKKFFMSPKTVVSTSATETINTVKEISTKIVDTTVSKDTSEPEIITLIDTPVKRSCDDERVNARATKVLKIETSKLGNSVNEGEPMDVDQNPSEKVPLDKIKAPNSMTEKQAKCKVRLDFVEKGEPVVIIDENASDGDCTTASTLTTVTKENEIDDWKLELSQDEEIVPKEISVSAVAVKESKVTKSSDLKEAPKRRIQFVTLSTKPTFKK